MAPEFINLMRDSFIKDVEFHGVHGNVDYSTQRGGYFKFWYQPQHYWEEFNLYLPFLYRGDRVRLMRYHFYNYGV